MSTLILSTVHIVLFSVALYTILRVTVGILGSRGLDNSQASDARKFPHTGFNIA